MPVSVSHAVLQQASRQSLLAYNEPMTIALARLCVANERYVVALQVVGSSLAVVAERWVLSKD